MLVIGTSIDCRIELEAHLIETRRNVNLKPAVLTNLDSLLPAFGETKVHQGRWPCVQPVFREFQRLGHLASCIDQRLGQYLDIGVLAVV